MKAALQALVAVIGLLVTFPIWIYLQYKVLQAVNASDLMWFLFWIYAPALFVMQAINGVIKAAFED